MMPTRSFIDCCKSMCSVYGFSGPLEPSVGPSNGLSATFAAASTASAETAGRLPSART